MVVGALRLAGQLPASDAGDSGVHGHFERAFPIRCRRRPWPLSGFRFRAVNLRSALDRWWSNRLAQAWLVGEHHPVVSQPLIVSMIDERELSFTREAPLLAWRLFRVRRLPDGAALCAPMIHSPAPPPWLSGFTVARCLEHDHAAPAPGCRCGIYAAIEGTLDSLPGYLLDTAHDGDPWTYAEVACSGRVFLDARGLRCEEARVVLIALAEGSFASADERGRASEELAARYGIRVGSSDAAPGWLTDNSREQGKPLDAESVDLSVLVETLERSKRRRARPGQPRSA